MFELVDQNTVHSLVQTVPLWQRNCLAAEALNLEKTTILHAGPPFASVARVPASVLNSACAALCFEGQAGGCDEAMAMIRNGAVALKPAQDFNTVVPLAGVVSASMWLHEIVGLPARKNAAYAPLNGGSGPAMRLGRFGREVVEHLRWINTELADLLNHNLKCPVPLIPIARRSLRKGDDCHGRTAAATAELIDRSFSHTLMNHERIRAFLTQSPSFFLNLWMAACKCMVSEHEGVQDCSLITAAAGNGDEVGIKISGLPKRWFTVKATPPAGDLGNCPASRATGAIGDSAIVDALGFGAMAVSFSKPQREALQRYLPDDCLELPRKLLLAENDQFGTLQLRTGLCAATVLKTQTTPIVSLGIIDRQGTDGRIGGGIYRYPLALFEAAMTELNKLATTG